MKYNELIAKVNKILSEYSIALTLRQIYYRLLPDIPNTRASYTALSSQLVKARERGEVDPDKLEDRSRGVIKDERNYYSNIDSFIDSQINFENISNYYDRDRWDGQEYYIEVWVEKDALSQVISNIAGEWRITTAPSRGYSSFSYLKDAVRRFNNASMDGKKCIILHFTDHDPSGLDMTRDLGERLNTYSEYPIEVKRIALTHSQVKQFKLPPNPTKMADSRSPYYVQQFGNVCWELDALPPDELEELVRDAILEYLDEEKWEAKEKEIEDERDAIDKVFDKKMVSLIKQKVAKARG